MVGAIIAEARKATKMKQEVLAKEAGVSRSYISDVEHGRYNPSLKTLLAICKALKIDLNIFSETTEKQEVPLSVIVRDI